MGNEQSNEARDEPNLETIENENVMTREQLRGIQSLFSTICDTLQSTLSEMCQLKEEEDFVKMENIDLCQALKGTVFKTRLNKLCDIKLINQTINTGFSQLQCDHCDQQAKIASECNQETSYKLYCELHFEQFGSPIQPSINLKHSKKLNRIVLKELERHLIQVQERIDYFHIENDKKDPIIYEKVKGLIEEDLEQLKNLLESMTIKCSKLNKLKTKTKKMKYEHLSFIKDDCEKSRNTIFKILSMIPEVCNKIESDSLVQVIVNSRKGVPLEEEVKENITHSISDRVYEKEYKLIHIPTQSLKSFKKFENKIKNNCKITETCIEKVRKLMDTADSINKMLQHKLDEIETQIIEEEDSDNSEVEEDKVEEEGKKVLEQLTLRDQQFYIDKLKLKGKDAENFKEGFTTASGVYKRLGQFDYGQPNCTTDHINTCINNNYDKWVYIGEVKEGTDNTPHGIGIRVWYVGNIREGYWEDGQLHGRGRVIWGDGDYYIGEWEEGICNGEGTHYDIYGGRYEGGCKNGDYYGQGTYYEENGDKYTGIWDDWKGQGEVNYKDGNKYEGYWDRKDGSFKRHGLGTLYSADGQVLNQGKWEWDKYKGKE